MLKASLCCTACVQLSVSSRILCPHQLACTAKTNLLLFPDHQHMTAVTARLMSSMLRACMLASRPDRSCSSARLEVCSASSS